MAGGGVGGGGRAWCGGRVGGSSDLGGEPGRGTKRIARCTGRPARSDTGLWRGFGWRGGGLGVAADFLAIRNSVDWGFFTANPDGTFGPKMVLKMGLRRV